ncbi:MAG TPA: protoporphyrinogen oxidase [Candidatus Omnitrophota bacterium]|nr:protoporphyrinogen oxidase [Candidatus Omnitrophota bacterium]HRY85793.1 protoporphyrinogen oxidase [Candidatus Omnitrophota bacterium]
MHHSHAVIVGGGISGLTAAYFLRQKALRENFPVKITLLESSDRFGGALQTIAYEDFWMETAADAFDAGHRDVLDLCGELGLGSELLEASPAFRRFSMFKGERIFSALDFPDSFHEAISFLKNAPLSLPTKCRMLREPFVSRKKEEKDESFADLICRRLGAGFVREFAGPLARGIYMAGPQHLSVKAVFPRLVEAERSYGSLTASWRGRGGEKKEKNPGFFAFRNGFEVWVKKLAQELRPCELRLSTPVRSCFYDAGWKILLQTGETLQADLLCLAVKAWESARLLEEASPELSRELSGIFYDSIITVPMVYRSENIPAQLADPKFLIPAPGEKSPFCSLKCLGGSADGKYRLFRVFISKTLLPEVFDYDDEVIREKILCFFKKTGHVRTPPEFVRVERYPRALPRYEPGHLERVARVEEKTRRHRGLYLAGNGFFGFGITDCVRRAKHIARNAELPDWQPCGG